MSQAEENTPSKSPLGSIGTVVTVHDEPNADGLHHHYRVSACDAVGEVVGPAGLYGRVEFQNGPVREVGVNGAQCEDLLGIVMHRLAAFQAGKFPCDENAQALAHVQAALHWMGQRTANRQARGVEGTSQV